MDPVVVIAIITVIIAIAIWMLATCLCIVPQGSTWVIERLGRYATTWEAGLHLKTPLLERVVRKISMKEQVADFEPQSVITKDNVTMNVDSVVYFQVIDPKALTYGVERPIAAIENLCATTLRNIIGSMTLDETLVGRETINAETIKVLDEATNKWGDRYHPSGSPEHHASSLYPGSDGEADEGRAREESSYPRSRR